MRRVDSSCGRLQRAPLPQTSVVSLRQVLKVVSGKGIPAGNFWFFDVASAVGGAEQHGMAADRVTVTAA